MTRAEKILSQTRKDKKRETAIGIPAELRDKILESIKNFDDATAFPVDDARRAIAYSWSLIAKLENEISNSTSEKAIASYYSSLVKATKSLVDQMLSHQKIQESIQKQKYIELSTHIAILNAIRDMFFLSLRKNSIPEAVITQIVESMALLEKDYPVMSLDMKEAKARLYGEVPEEKVIYLPEQPPDQLQEISDLIDRPAPKRKPKVSNEEDRTS